MPAGLIQQVEAEYVCVLVEHGFREPNIPYLVGQIPESCGRVVALRHKGSGEVDGVSRYVRVLWVSY